MTGYSGIHMVIGALLLLQFVVVNIQRLRSMVTGRAAKTVGETGVLAVLVLVSVVAANLIANMVPKRFDLTEQGLFSLSDQTTKILKNLDVDVKALVFQQGGAAPQAEDLLKQYNYAQEHFSYKVIDPDRNPGLAQKYEIRQDGTIVLESAGKTQKVTKIDEQELTNSLMKLVAGRDVVVGFLTGHGESSIDDKQNAAGLASFKIYLEEENYKTKSVSIVQAGGIPKDIDILVVAGAEQNLFAPEVSAIEQFAADGGRLLLTADPGRTGVAPLAASWGIAVENAMVLDESLSLFSGPQLGVQVIVNSYGSHEAVRAMHNMSIFQQACALKATDGSANEPDVLFSSSDKSWAESDIDRLLNQQEAEKGPGDIAGPVPLAMAFTGAPSGFSSKADVPAANGAIVCDTDFLSNRYIGQGDNANLAMNLVAWMSGQHEKISISPKKRGMNQLNLSQAQMINIFYATVLIFPEGLLLLGLFVWWKRRQRS